MAIPTTPSAASTVHLYARIKRTSEYYHQGLDEDNKPLLFPVEQVQNDYYAFRLNCNNYRQDDLVFFVKTPAGHFIQL